MHSPYQKICEAPLNDRRVAEHRRYLRECRVHYSNDDVDPVGDFGKLLSMSEDLFDHIDFLDEKLNIKKREIAQLHMQFDKLQEKAEAVGAENKALKEEAAMLKGELKKAVANPVLAVHAEFTVVDENLVANGKVENETQPDMMVKTDSERRDGKRKAESGGSLDERAWQKAK